MNTPSLAELLEFNVSGTKFSIALAGDKGHGKDTVADIMLELATYCNLNYVFNIDSKYALANPIKQYLAILFGWRTPYAMDTPDKKESQQPLVAVYDSIQAADACMKRYCSVCGVLYTESMSARKYLDDTLCVASMTAPSGEGSFYMFSRTPRELYTSFGTDFIRENFCEDFWITYFKNLYSDSTVVPIVTDVRRENEAEVLREMGYFLIQVVDPRKQKPKDDVHVTEQGLPHYLFDVSIVNDGNLSELRSKVLVAFAKLNKYFKAELKQF